MMLEAIKNFHTQFGFEPVIEGRERWKRYDKFIVAGMGGSHLAADLIKTWAPSIDITIHTDYGLPPLSEAALSNRLTIVSSYSGNTEEALDTFHQALERKLPLAAITVGGKLLESVKRASIPYVKLPDTGIQPRSALGYNFKALLKLMGEDEALSKAAKLVFTLNPQAEEPGGKALAERIGERVPIVYSSARNQPIAYNWKIKFNETGKIPAFANVLPELNHNEMTGFDVKESTKNLSRIFYFIFLSDTDDHLRIKIRMKILEELYRKRDLPVETVMLKGENAFHKIFSSLILADWTSYYIAEHYGLDSEQVPMVEEFKKLIQ